MAPKLTDDHIHLPMFTKMRVNLAAQVLSHSVAAGISTLQKFGKLHEDAKYTAEFVDFFDKLFNCFNSSSLKSSQFLRNAVTNESDHLPFLQKAMAYLSELKLPNAKTLPCITGWMISINSLLLLWQDLSSNHNYSSLMTNRLNQDCVENLFSIIRGKGGKRDNPDVREFRASYRQVVFDQLLLPSPGSNCQLDPDEVLLDLTNISFVSDVRSVNTNAGDDAQSNSNITSPTSLPVQNVAAYMAGYLIRRSNITECTECIDKFKAQDVQNKEIYSFLNEKNYGSLVYPSESFVSIVLQWESNFKTDVDHVLHMGGILNRLTSKSMNTCDTFQVCSVCKPKLSSMLKLYMKVRVHAALKRFNKSFTKNRTGKQNRKLLKLSHL